MGCNGKKGDIYECMSVGMSVCVNHLNRCKTCIQQTNAESLRLLNRTQANEDACWEVCNYSGTPEWYTCHPISICHWSGMGLSGLSGLSGEPLSRPIHVSRHPCCSFDLFALICLLTLIGQQFLWPQLGLRLLGMTVSHCQAFTTRIFPIHSVFLPPTRYNRSVFCTADALHFTIR